MKRAAATTAALLTCALTVSSMGCASAGAETVEGQQVHEGPHEKPSADPKKASAGQADPAIRATRVEVARVEPAAARMQMKLPGEVEGGHDALLAAALGGFVEKVYVHEGDQVHRGQILARVDSQIYAARQAQAGAELAAAKRELERAKKMGDAIPQAKLDAAETQVATTQAGYRTAQVQASRAMIRAPFDGVVADVVLEEGEVAAPGAPVIRLVQLDPVEVTLSVADRDVVALREGSKVSVRTDAEGDVFHGVIAHISPAADLKTRTFEVKVNVPNPDHRLLPGMIATVEVDSGVGGKRIVLPQYVLVTARSGNGVFVVQGGRARWRPVRVGPIVGSQIVIEDGISPGDEVVVTGHRELADGDAVIVQRKGTCCTDGRVQFGGAEGKP